MTFKKKCAEIGDKRQRMEVINPDHKVLSVRKQCEILSVPRSSLNFQPIPEKTENVKMMNLMEESLLMHPTEGEESMVDWLKEKGYPVGPKAIRRLFKLVDHQMLYRRKNLNKGALREFIKPYLLRGLKVTNANQVWCAATTCIPMAKGFLYMTTFIDVYSRKIIGWGISIIMSMKWCLEVLKDAFRQHGKPEILRSDQGTQYTSPGWINCLEENEIKVSIDGKGSATDNTRIERFWKSLKNNHIYLNPCDTGLELFKGVQRYIEY